MSIRLFIAGAILALCASPSLAQQEPPPPDPRDIPVEAFVSGGRLTSASMAPDGSRFAYTEMVDGKSIVIIVDAATRTEIRRVDVGEAEYFRWFRWAGPNRILLSRLVEIDNARYWARTSRLLVFDLRTQELDYIGFQKQRLEGDDVLWIDPDGQSILLSVIAKNANNPEVWRFPLDGRGEKAAVKIQDGDGDVDEWWADDAGVVRLGMGFTRRGAMMIHYRRHAGEKLQRITKLERFHDDREAWGVIRLFAGSDTGYTLFEQEDGRTELREFDYSTGELGEVVYAHETRDVESLRFDETKLISASYIEDEPETHWFDPQLASYHAMLEAALPGGRISIGSMSRDRSRMLVRYTGPADPGALYVFTPGEGKLDLFANYRPEVDFRALSKPEPFSFTSRDGHTMHGYLTLPAGREARGLPLIVYPHGGPYGVRDAMVYDDWLQLLAARGYAVMQVNYRGSGGYGKEFEEMGYGQIGLAMQDDLDDALDHVVAQGAVDPRRVCLVGASYGGYAALWGAIRNPERYVCAVSFAGVTDYTRQMEYDRYYLGKAFYRRYWEDRIEGEGGRNLDNVSPAFHASRIQRPLLVVHGKSDRRVPFSQYNALHRAVVRTDKPVEFLALEDGHNLAKQENEEKFLTTMLAFLQKHNPAFKGESAGSDDGGPDTGADTGGDSAEPATPALPVEK